MSPGSSEPTGSDLIETTITSLEMWAVPPGLAEPEFGQGLRVERALRASTAFYRFLYNTVGEDWLWSERRRWSNQDLTGVLQHPDVELWVLYADGQPAGYAELDGRKPNEIELAYFGLMPSFVGRGLGPRLLRFAIRTAWERPVHRLWVHTCNFDHPSALPLYRRCGFVPFATDTHLMRDPRIAGLLPRQAAPHVPLPVCL